MENKIELIECPHCGNQDVQGIYARPNINNSYWNWVECLNCGAMGPKQPTMEKAIEKWNARVKQEGE